MDNAFDTKQVFACAAIEHELVFSSNGEYLCVKPSLTAASTRIFLTENGALVRTFEEEMACVAIDHNVVATCGGRGVRLWQLPGFSALANVGWSDDEIRASETVRTRFIDGTGLLAVIATSSVRLLNAQCGREEMRYGPFPDHRFLDVLVSEGRVWSVSLRRLTLPKRRKNKGYFLSITDLRSGASHDLTSVPHDYEAPVTSLTTQAGPLSANPLTRAATKFGTCAVGR